MKSPYNSADNKNMILAAMLAAVLIVCWQIFIELPKRQKLAEWNAAQQVQKVKEDKARAAAFTKTEEKMLPRPEQLAQSPRIAISTPSLHGSLNLKGLRIDDLTLAKYRTELAPDSPDVTLLTPSGQEVPYFMEIGWVSADGTKVPDAQTVWKASAATLSPDKPLLLQWNNGAGVTFKVEVAVDADYMFTFRQTVENHGAAAINISPYALINRGYSEVGTHAYILHEGPLGVGKDGLKEISYQSLRDEGKQALADMQGWAGFTDKYWLTALVPGTAGATANFSHYVARGDRYQADYAGAPLAIQPGAVAQTDMRFFAGAKEIDVLDAYTEGKKGGQPVPLFDRAVDLGIFYFLTKPIFLTLNFFYDHIGNFGVAILLLTVLIKLCMFPLANKAYRAGTQMRDLQPEILKIREKYADDKMKMQTEIMQLYKRMKVNPAAGCLPMIIQIPVFFSLYKVLYVTIEMRHAPFFGWIRDLSAADPTNIFTAFGLIAWNPPSAMHLGILPILMSISMALQMKSQPTPPDPTQAKVMKMLPYIFIIFFAKMPAGLLIYWTWSNMISIVQQKVITWQVHKHQAEEKKGKMVVKG